MLDFIIAVDNPLAWHTLNLDRNPHHYSALMRTLGPSAIAALQQTTFGARVYFNTRIPCPNSARLFKYGVISTESLLADLRAWNTLYISGRLHKPVHTLIPDSTIAKANKTNLLTATAAALVTLPTVFSEPAFYTATAALSYASDPRFFVRAEHPDKVANLVAPNLTRFRELYRAQVSSLTDALYAPSTTSNWSQSSSRQSLQSLISLLPLSIITRMEHVVGHRPGLSAVLRRKGFGDGEIRKAAAECLAGFGRSNCKNALMKAVGMVVWSSSVRQSVKGIFTAGIGRSLAYARDKLKKGWGSRVMSKNVK